jgi:hypothetical protein
MNSRGTASHSSGIRASVSNLYPDRSANPFWWRRTPIAHHVLAGPARVVGRPLALLLLLRILGRVIFLDESGRSARVAADGQAHIVPFAVSLNQHPSASAMLPEREWRSYRS